MKPSCLEGDNHTIEICRCRIEHFDRFFNYRHFTGVAKGIRSLCRQSEVYDATDRMSYPETQMLTFFSQCGGHILVIYA